MNLINKRVQLEKKYSNYCLYFGIPLPEKGGRVMSISPSGYYYHTGVNSNLIDSLEYKEISKKAHFGLRLEIETEVAQLIDLDIFEGDYFFDKKNNIANMSMEELNKYLILFGCKTLKKDKFNRLQRLFRKWNEESIKCHYKITGAKKRIHKKLKERNENGFLE